MAYEKLILWLMVLLSINGISIAQNCDGISILKLSGGEQYVGKIVEQSDDTIIYLNSTLLGILKFPKTKIKSISCVDTNYIVTVTLKDQSTLFGIFEGMDSSAIFLRNDYLNLMGGGQVYLTLVLSISFTRRIDGVKSTVGNPNSTRYFFAPSAIPIEKGEGYYQNAYLLMNSANFGITRNFSLGGGIVIPVLFYITPKISFKMTKNVYIGAGAIYTTTFIPELNFGAGIPYGLFTYGNHERNITLGSGYGLVWINKEMSKTPYPIITANSMFRLSRKIQLVTENWIVPVTIKQYEDVQSQDMFGNPIFEERYVGDKDEFYMAFSVGSRFIFSEKSSVDFAPILLYINDQTIVIPYLDFVYRF